MKPEILQSLTLIEQALAITKLTRAEHVAIQNAVDVLRLELQPRDKVKKE